jgi:hypothetical protein
MNPNASEIPLLDWYRIQAEAEFLLNNFAQWHAHGHGFNEGAD